MQKDCDNWTFEFFRKKLENIEHTLEKIVRRENIIMAQIDDLNAAIAAEDVEITDIMASIAAVAADITRLIALVAAGNIPTDLTAQLTAVQSHLATLTTGAAQLKAADAEANPPA